MTGQDAFLISLLFFFICMDRALHFYFFFLLQQVISINNTNWQMWVSMNGEIIYSVCSLTTLPHVQIRKIICSKNRVKNYLCFPTICHFWWNTWIKLKIVLDMLMGPVAALVLSCFVLFSGHWCAMKMVESIAMRKISAINCLWCGTQHTQAKC